MRHCSPESISVEGVMGKKKNEIQSRRASEQPCIYATVLGRKRCMTTERTFMGGCGRESVSAPEAWALAQFIPQFGQLVVIVLNLQLKTN